MADKISCGFGSSSIPIFFPVIVPFASFSAFVSCQNSQINICKNDFMWDQLEKKCTIISVYVCMCKSFRPFFLASCRTETRSQCLQRVCMIRFQNYFSMVPQKSLISWFPLGKSGPQFEFGNFLLGMKTHIIKPPYLLQTVV